MCVCARNSEILRANILFSGYVVTYILSNTFPGIGFMILLCKKHWELFRFNGIWTRNIRKK